MIHKPEDLIKYKFDIIEPHMLPFFSSVWFSFYLQQCWYSVMEIGFVNAESQIFQALLQWSNDGIGFSVNTHILCWRYDKK